MQNQSSHGFAYNVVFGAVLLAITLIFGSIIFVITNVDFAAKEGFTLDTPGVVLLVGGALGLIALLSGLVYIVARADNDARMRHIENMEKYLRN